MMRNEPAHPQPTVIIPAHDEQSVITRCLDSVFDSFSPGEVRVVVVANGCTDDTAAVARRHPGRPTVVELEVGSKVAALNAGDAAASGFPRAYVDADVRFEPGSLTRALGALGGQVLASAPPVVFAVAGRPWAVRAFYKTWSDLPFLSDRPVGNGVYVLSEQGRARFGPFPNVIADDLFVLRQFSYHERAVPEGPSFVVETPRSLRFLLRVRRRVYTGNAQLAADLGCAIPSDDNHAPNGPSRRQAVLHGLVSRRAPEVMAYCLINLLALVHVRLRPGPAGTWERDESTRA